MTKQYHKRDNRSIEKITNVISGWPKVLADAEKGLADAQRRVRQLKRAIRTLKAKVAADEDWPLGNVS
jgi:hypothetical protein